MKDWGGNGRWPCGRKFLGENLRSKIVKKKYEPKYKTIIFGQSLAQFNVLWFGFETQWLTTLYFLSNLVRFKRSKNVCILIERLSSSVPGWEELQWIPISWSPWSGKTIEFLKLISGLWARIAEFWIGNHSSAEYIILYIGRYSLVKFRNILEVHRHWN